MMPVPISRAGRIVQVKLLALELREREANRVTRMMKQAGFPVVKKSS